MAVVQDWTPSASTVADRALGAEHPSATRHFAGGDASSWCVHTAAGIYRAVTVDNLGATDLYVAVGPHLSGARSAGQHAKRIPTGQGYRFSLAGGSDGQTRFSTWGEDGASHAMDFVFELQP